VLRTWSCTVKLDEQNPTYAGLAQENGFGSALLQRWPWVVKGASALCTCRKECKKYDPTAAQCFWSAHHNDLSRWFAISIPPPIWCPGFGFVGGVAKEYITKLGCEKYFRRVITYWAPMEILISLSYDTCPTIVQTLLTIVINVFWALVKQFLDWCMKFGFLAIFSHKCDRTRKEWEPFCTLHQDQFRH
jgi:hypothetical protein